LKFTVSKYCNYYKENYGSSISQSTLAEFWLSHCLGVLGRFHPKVFKKSLKIPKRTRISKKNRQHFFWSKKKVQKDKQRSTKHTYKTKYRVTRTPLKTGGELRYSGRVSSSCSTKSFDFPI